MAAAVTLDTEWAFQGGRLDCETAFAPVILCAKVLPSGEDFSFLGRDPRLAAFVAAHRDHVFVAHSATAEMKFLIRQGIALPPRWFCTMTAFRSVMNKPGYLSASLAEALNVMGLAHLVPLNKEEIRNKILHIQFTDLDLPEIANYCHGDVAATAALYEKLVSLVDPIAMGFWVEYLKAVAQIELRGIATDVITLRRILDNRQTIREALIDRTNRTARVYRSNGSFSAKAFFKWVRNQGIVWPRKSSLITGRPYQALDNDTLKAMESRHPFIAELRQTRKTLRTLGKFGIKVDGHSGRHHPSIMPFRSVTGRNQPSKFIFSGPKWLRFLIVPPSADHVLVYVDYSAQEIGVAAALSNDEAMRTMYAAADPHLAFAIMAGAAPATATKATHKSTRDIYKTVNLAVLYGQTAEGIAERLGIELDASRALLAQHLSLFRVFHEWSDRVVSASYSRGYAVTPCGWRAKVPADSKFRTWANFPVQATAADIMRATTIALDRQGVQVLAIVHDGWLLTCRRGQQDQLRAAVEHARQFACRKVLKDFPLKLDWTEFVGRFEDDSKSARESWEFIQSVLPKERLHVPAE
jgi:DNA polymerase I